MGADALSVVKKQNETGFVHSCPAEAYPMKKQIYEKEQGTIFELNMEVFYKSFST
jgi:uncharacterized pyridoxamine 5'-phosphate oxidase family protein